MLKTSAGLQPLPTLDTLLIPQGYSHFMYLLNIKYYIFKTEESQISFYI